MYMSEVILVTGGARSGKSRMAEKMASRFKRVVYIATAVPLDEEMKQRIQRHKKRRPSGWATVEKNRGLSAAIAKCGDADAILVDCITVMITNVLMDIGIDWDHPNSADLEKAESEVMKEIDEICAAAVGFTGCVILVTNEVGMSLVSEYPLGRAFRDIAGFANQRLARICDSVYLMISGIPLKIKG